ncbi:NAD(P)H-dependent flavin oxidoreductase [Halotalea alkalilenta]|uniref:Nitronate monooxygenase n=1 Tax=Halotalea alkalilenta TaxID=376489 RepID=A0A172YBL6_9GAMM|nr:nitronate monooxygenase [Halotalea alkalilenta]ANF56614.1 hypothetical protein A5892_03305 [Halotalea alkalilenta]
MIPSTALTRTLGLSLPIIQAPMAGGATTPALVAAVSNAGGLGSLAAAMLSPEQIVDTVAEIRELTDRPFAINLFVLDTPRPDPAEVETAWARLAPLHAELGIEPSLPTRWCQPFDEQLHALLECRPAVASFTFGILDPLTVERLHAAESLVIGTATRVEEAIAWERAGAYAVCAQGAQAGGHRGTFIGPIDEALHDTGALVEACVEAIDLPVIAAGGVMDGTEIAALLARGAQAAQLGTAFLACDESGIPAAYKEALEAASGETRLTRSFSGRAARGLPNHAMRLLGEFEREAPDYPLQNALTAAMRAEGARRNDAEYLSLWAGQGVARLRRMGAMELLARLAAELDAAAVIEALDETPRAER